MEIDCFEYNASDRTNPAVTNNPTDHNPGHPKDETNGFSVYKSIKSHGFLTQISKQAYPFNVNPFNFNVNFKLYKFLYKKGLLVEVYNHLI